MRFGTIIFFQAPYFTPKSRDPKAKRVATTEDDRLWHHLAASYDPETDRVAIYIDGAPQPKGTEGTPGFLDPTEGFVLGGLLTSSGRAVRTDGLVGNLDDLAIWSRVLHQAEVRVLFHQRESDTSLGDLLERQRLADAPQDDDEDGLPDRWERAVGLQATVNDRQDDLDGDGLTNIEEFMRQTHPGKTDTDGDSVPDATETNLGTWTSLQDRGTNPNIADSDGDGLTDGDEFLTTPEGSDPNVPDTDEDGIIDAAERFYGSLPGDAESTPALVDGLLAYLPLDGSLTESYGGTVSRWNEPEESQYEEGRFGRAALFGDDQQFVELRDGSIRGFDFANQSFTVSLWFQLRPGAPKNGVLINQGGMNGWEISNLSYEGIRVDTYQESVSRQPRALGSNGFDHLVMVVTPELNRTSVYLNGKRLAPRNGQHPDALIPFIETAGEPLILGNHIWPWGSRSFNGSIDEVAIWRRALAETEILALCESGQPLSVLASLNRDHDGDGHEDFREQFAGTDPSQASDVFQISSIRWLDGRVTLEWPTKPGRFYHVERSPAMAEAPWQTITPAPLVDGLFTDQVSRVNGLSGFYRIRALKEGR